MADRRLGWTPASAGNRLDQPRVPRRLRLPHPSAETFGHFAEGFASFMGTARFIGYMTVFVIVWITLNLVGLYRLRWDPYPFILLNLFFSTQASYAAPLILLAQNRQADRDRLALDEDRRRAALQKADTEYLSREIASLRIAVGEVSTRDFVRSELSRLIEELDEINDRRYKLERAPQRRESGGRGSAGDARSAGPGGGAGAGGGAGPESLAEPFDEQDSDVAEPPHGGAARRPREEAADKRSPRASRG
jgi:uncharacterized membrane protein